MPKFRIEFTEELWQRIDIEAKDIDEAREKFWNFDFDWSDMTNIGGEIPNSQSVDIEELPND